MARQDTVSWCDKLASTPTAGFKLNPDYVPSTVLLQAFAPIFNKLHRDDKPQFQIDRLDHFNLVYTTHDGIQTSIEPTRVAVAFVHRLKAKPVSGGPPQLEMLSKPQPYTKMLPFCLNELIEATALLPDSRKRTLDRVGIITTTAVDEEVAPPGFRKLLTYFAKPWGNLQVPYSFMFVSTVREDAEVTERCVHSLSRGEEEESLLNLSIDWQRVFKKPRAVNEDHMKEVARNAERAALNYFEELAEGTRLL